MFYPESEISPKAITEEILSEFQKTSSEGYYGAIVRHSFTVFLHRDLYERLGDEMIERIKSDSKRALQQKLDEINRKNAPAILGWIRPRRPKGSTPAEALGKWEILFRTIEDDHAASQLIVKATAVPTTGSSSYTGDPTQRAPSPGDHTPFHPNSLHGQHLPVGALVYAELIYVDDQGPQSRPMVKDLIKVGRGGNTEWVDIQIRTTKPQIAKEHFELRRHSAGNFTIKSLTTSATSTTKVNGHPVLPSLFVRDGQVEDRNIQAPLNHSDRITLGDDALTIRFRVAGKE